jgi:hypothetical protein
VAPAPFRIRRTGDDGQLALPLVVGSRPRLPSDRHNRRRHQLRLGPFRGARFQ